MVGEIIRFLKVLSPDSQRRVLLHTSFLGFVAFVELVCASGLMPFIAVASNPEKYTKHWAVQFFTAPLGAHSTLEVLKILGVLVIVVLAVGNCLSALALWMSNRFAADVNVELSNRVLANYLSRPYVWHTTQNSSHLVNAVIGETSAVVNGYLLAIMRACSRLSVLAAILLGMIAVNPMVAFSSLAMLGVTYTLIYTVVRKRLNEISFLRVQTDRARYKVVNEAFGTTKTNILLGRQPYFASRNQALTRISSGLQASQVILGELPRYFLEFTAFAGVVACILFLMGQLGDFKGVLPILTLYAFAAYRLLPAMQQLFSFVTSIKGHSFMARGLVATLEAAPNEGLKEASPQQLLPFRSSLNVQDVSFRFEQGERDIIDHVTLSIAKNSTVALVGTTGAGKTTLMDVLLGLLSPTSGVLLVDGAELTDSNLRDWMTQLGYVPQEIFLSDDTIRANIAYGLPSDLISHERVVRASTQAALHDFVLSLPLGYDTVVGDRGVRLSGGQRQRIGIARALYGEPGVLVFDEATSALDGVTEQAIMDAIRNLSGSKTIIMVAHRLSTVRFCDQIFFMEGGKITHQGTYDQLMESCPEFRAMASQVDSPP